MKNALVILALFAAVASATTTVETVQYNWIWDWILINIDFFLVAFVSPFYIFSIIFGNPTEYGAWVVKFMEDPLWRLSFKSMQ